MIATALGTERKSSIPFLLLASFAFSLQSGIVPDRSVDEIREFLGGKDAKVVYVVGTGGWGENITHLAFIDLTDPSFTVQTICENCVSGYHSSPQISPDGTRVTFGKKGTVYAAELKADATPVQVSTGYAPHWWVDSEGNEYIISNSFNSTDNTSKWPPQSNWQSTWIQKIATGSIQPEGPRKDLLPFQMNAGRTGCGKYMGNAQPGIGMVELLPDASENAYVKSLWNSGRRCNGSMNPAREPVFSGKLAILEGGGHLYVKFFDETGKMVKQISSSVPGKPKMHWSEWSTEEDYFTYTVAATDAHRFTEALSTCVVHKLSTDETLQLCTAAEPHLWIGSSPVSIGSSTGQADGKGKGHIRISGTTLRAVPAENSPGTITIMSLNGQRVYSTTFASARSYQLETLLHKGAYIVLGHARTAKTVVIP